MAHVGSCGRNSCLIYAELHELFSMLLLYSSFSGHNRQLLTIDYWHTPVLRTQWACFMDVYKASLAWLDHERHMWPSDTSVSMSAWVHMMATARYVSISMKIRIRLHCITCRYSY